MTVRSWSEFRVFQDGTLVYTARTEKEAVKWAKDSRSIHVNLNVKYVCKEISIAEIPKRRFEV